MKADFKQKIYDKCLQIINEKIITLKAELNSLSESASNESKSTAGDKHETGRAMIQLEIEKLGGQLKDVENQKSEFEKIDTSLKNEIGKGCVVLTNKGYLFVGIALGRLSVDSESIHTLSLNSPLGKKLTGLKAGDTTETNGVTYIIEQVI